MTTYPQPDIESWAGDGWPARAYIAYARRTPAHPWKIRIFRWLGRNLFPYGLPMRGHGGTRIRINTNDYIGHHISFSRAYEPQSLALVKQLLEAGGTFLDVGANFGLYTCPISRLPGIECIAVDASATAFALLQDNLRLNPDARVRAVNVALGRQHGLVVLDTPVENNLGTTRVTGIGSSSCGVATMVACMRLSELMSDLGVMHIEVMKIDVEGFEIEVLKGMDLAADRGPRNIIMEHSVRMS